MRAGRPAGRADIADHVALADVAARADAHLEARHVGVERLEIVGVADLHRAAVVEVQALVVDHPVGCGIDRLAGLALEVDAVVEAAAGAAVVAALAERRGDAGIRLGAPANANRGACLRCRTSLPAGRAGRTTNSPAWRNFAFAHAGARSGRFWPSAVRPWNISNLPAVGAKPRRAGRRIAEDRLVGDRRE